MAGDPALAIGQALKTAREEAGMSLQDVAERTRLSSGHLNALETGHFESLPGVGYIPGFIRNYCQAIGIDAAPHIESFKSLSSAVTRKPEYSFPVQALVPRIAGSMIAMFVVLVGLTVYVGWTFISYNQSDEPELIASSISQVDQPDLLLENNPARSDDRLSDAEQNLSDAAPLQQDDTGPAVRQTPQTDTLSVAENAPQPDTPSPLTSSEPALTLPQPEAVAAADTPAPAPQPDAEQTQTAALTSDDGGLSDTAAAVQTPADETVSGVGAQATQRLPGEEVVIRAVASSWIEVTRADGEVLVTKLMRRGDELVFSSDENLFLSTGNAGGLRLEMPNIDAFDAGQTGEILRDLRLNRESLQTRQAQIAY